MNASPKTRCDRCNRRSECAQVPSSLGLFLGRICASCRQSEARYVERSQRALARFEAPQKRAKPVHAAIYVRRFPEANRIAAELAKAPALLSLRTRRLAQDVCDVFRVHPTTARLAVAMARRAA